MFAFLLNPKYNVNAKKIKKSHQQPKVHQPLREIVTAEVTSFHEFVSCNRLEIFNQVDNGIDISKWWAQHHERYPKMALVFEKSSCYPFYKCQL